MPKFTPKSRRKHGTRLDWHISVCAPDLEAPLKAAALAANISVTEFVRQAVKFALDNMDTA